MRRLILSLILALYAFSAPGVQAAAAQTETPPASPTALAGPMGKVIGKVMNRNSGMVVAESLEVMLHILDQDLADKGMLHAQSEPDGTFAFTDVPFDVVTKFAVMAIFEGVTYYSEVAPADMASLQVSVEVPVYDSTSDLTGVQVDQMHVLFGMAQDGLETKEIYVFSSQSSKTVKEAFKLDDQKTATLQFPLPEDADYIFFQPDDRARFVKFSGGFADTYAIVPGAGPSQIMVSYLVPYSGERTYSYTAPINVARINFLLPDRADLSLEGRGLTGPESMRLQEGGSYRVYTYTDLAAGQTVTLTIAGRGTDGTAGTHAGNVNSPTAIALGILGLLVIAGGSVWWYRNKADDEGEPESETDFDRTVNGIARLDEVHDQGGMDEEQYRQRRQALRERARALLEKDGRRE